MPKLASPPIQEYLLALGVAAPGTDYVPLRRLGAGGMGTVWEAVKPPGIRSALKVMHPHLAAIVEFVERFMHEVALMAKLDAHPNLTKIKDWGKFPDGVPYIIMEMLDGKTLHRLNNIARRRRTLMDPFHVHFIAEQFCDALTWLHTQTPPVVHRDFKPENVFVQKVVSTSGPPKNLVKLLDFGIARSLDGKRERARGLGTPKYMAPEQIHESEVTPAADVFAVALVIYELLTGRMPYDAPDQDILEAHLWAEPLAPSLFAPWLTRSVDKALLAGLSKDPRKRPASPNALMELLASLKFVKIDGRPQGDLVNITGQELYTMVGMDEPEGASGHPTIEGMPALRITGPSLEVVLTPDLAAAFGGVAEPVAPQVSPQAGASSVPSGRHAPGTLGGPSPSVPAVPPPSHPPDAPVPSAPQDGDAPAEAAERTSGSRYLDAPVREPDGVPPALAPVPTPDPRLLAPMPWQASAPPPDQAESAFFHTSQGGTSRSLTEEEPSHDGTSSHQAERRYLLVRRVAAAVSAISGVLVALCVGVFIWGPQPAASLAPRAAATLPSAALSPGAASSPAFTGSTAPPPLLSPLATSSASSPAPSASTLSAPPRLGPPRAGTRPAPTSTPSRPAKPDDGRDLLERPHALSGWEGR